MQFKKSRIVENNIHSMSSERRTMPESCHFFGLSMTCYPAGLYIICDYRTADLHAFDAGFIGLTTGTGGMNDTC